MALAKTSVTLLASQSVAAGLTKATAVFGAWVDTRAYGRQTVRWKLTNGASAPGVAPTLIVQTSPDNGTNIYDEYTVGGDTVASSVNSGPISTDDTTMYVRVGFYGHTTNAVTCEATLQTETL
jgi:tetrahydromethanopterin S-methyltransferase subunit D